MNATRKRKMAAPKRDRRGASMVEFAILAPVMFFFIFGIIEFGRLVMVQQAMTNAAREAGREASLITTLNASDVETTARDVMQSVMANASDTAKCRINVTPASLANMTSGTPCTVDVAVDFADVSWLPGSILGVIANPELTAEATYDRE